MVAEIVIAASSTATVLLPALYFGGNAALNFILPYRRLKTLIVDMKELVDKGLIQRSHGREAMMQEMISGVVKGSLILHGPPGCGKTALLEELAFRIIKNEVRSLKNWHVVRLNLKVAKGDAGLKSQIDNTLNGGVENKLRLLVSYVGGMFANGKHCILIIDEIQDLLLAGNISIFDSFKEEFARKQLHIIGATTDFEITSQLRTRVGTGSGMERRIEIIELKEMTQDEAAEIIDQRKQQPLSSTSSSVTFCYTKRFTRAVVEFAKVKYPNKVFPDCAVSLFDDVRRFYFDKHSEANSIKISAGKVAKYVGMVTDKPIEPLMQQFSKVNENRSFKEKFESRFFPSIKPTVNEVPQVLAESERLRIFLKSSLAPFLFLKGDSELFLTEVASQACDEDQEVVLCDLKQIVKEASHSDGRSLLKTTLQNRIAHNSKNPLFILKGMKREWCTEAHVVKNELNFAPLLNEVISPLGEAIDKFTTQLGMGSIKERTPTPLPKEEKLVKIEIPAVISELFKFIEEEKLPTVVLLVDADFEPSRNQWSTMVMEPLTFDERVDFLSSKYTESSQKFDDEIAPIMGAFYYLHDGRSSPMDLTAQVLENKSSGNDAQDILRVLDGFKSLSQIQDALAKSDDQIVKNPISLIGVDGKKMVLDSELRSKCQQFIQDPSLKVLWIAENSLYRQKYLSFQMASFFKQQGSISAWHEIMEWRDVPQQLTELLLQSALHSEDLKSCSLVFTTDAGLKEPAIIKLLEKKSHKIVCFYSPVVKKAPEKDNLLDKGEQFLKDVLGSEPPTLALPQWVPPALQLASLTASPFSLKAKEIDQMFDFFIPKSSEEGKPQLLRALYKIFITKGFPLDIALQRLMSDLETLKKVAPTKLLDKFANLHGEELEMSLREIQYAVDPTLTSWSYRSWRFVADGALSTFNLISIPFQWMFTHATASLMSLAGGWLITRFRSGALFGRK